MSAHEHCYQLTPELVSSEERPRAVPGDVVVHHVQLSEPFAKR
jgi:hypothetical protein